MKITGSFTFSKALVNSGLKVKSEMLFKQVLADNRNENDWVVFNFPKDEQKNTYSLRDC